ncbi:MAG: aspartate aminotransferase family protein [Deltaproteobacteria bacterium]|nr:aspartate aminotransferase family protein [Deltaproteobacteria bacterium]MBW2018130.1 aspartate aminotransferase family protein [Deltaproteobacteria bacterium]MBW2129057.1 aspartate aminotransferase family protein [Deltaproteobacteria bacterium]MBW2303056.1 aspartate aminotransferase family protein [Deltaproteobacteria bacterium]
MSKFTLARGWIEEDKQHLLHGGVPLRDFSENGTPLILESAKGIRIRDIHGREYIDALAGAVCVNCGYGRQELAEVAREQMSRLSYAESWSGVAHTAAIEYAQALSKFTPPGLDRFFFVNSGAEANEAAYKIARYYWATKGYGEKTKIISRKLSYHGLNLFSMWATGIDRFHNKVGSPNPDVLYTSECYCYRCPFGKDYPGCNLECAEALAETIEQEGKDRVAAFVAEPIYGVSGTICPPPEYFPKIREICDAHDVLLILDEVMTGFGRTGKNFACMHWNITPDLLCMSKGMISSSLPIAGVAFTDKIFQGMLCDDPFPHLHTCGAHPVACAVAKKNLEILIDENLVENSANMGRYMLDELEKLQEYPFIGQVQGMGLFLGFELVQDQKTREPFANKAEKRLVKAILEEGIIVRPGGSRIQIGPPLIVTREEVDEILEGIKRAVKKFKP